MKPFNRALTGALALAALMPLSAHAQSTPPADAAAVTAPTTTATPPMDSTTPPADRPATTPAPPAAAAVTSGATVYGSDGAPVGTIASVAGGNAVVDTGTRKATLALNAFGSGPQGPTITVTKAQLENAVAKAMSSAPAATEPPANVKKKDK
jgi:hypothetical protein